MIDLETLGKDADATILQISIQAFDPNKLGAVGKAFNAFIDIESQEDRRIDPNTLKWWLTQDQTLFRGLIFPGKELSESLEDALIRMNAFLKDAGITNMWANSPSFDINIMRHACKSRNMKFPIAFWKEWDVRTMKNTVEIQPGEIMAQLELMGVKELHKHDARDDVLHQIVHMQLVNQHISGR